MFLRANLDDLYVITGSAGNIFVSTSAMRVDGSTPPVVQPIPDLGPMAEITGTGSTLVIDTSGMTSGHTVALRYMSIRNNHATNSNVIEVTVDNGTHVNTHIKCTLLAGESLHYLSNGRWVHLDANAAEYPSVGNAASQAEMEAGTATDRYVTPQGVNWHPGVAKFWIKATPGGTVNASWNVTSEADATAGVMDVTIATDFSGTHYAAGGIAMRANTNTTVTDAKNSALRSATMAAGTISLETYDQTATNYAIEDPTFWCMWAFGDQ